MKLEFVQELTEARMFRFSDTLDGRNISDIAELVYKMLLTLEMTSHYDNKFVREYATKMLAYYEFHAMNTSRPDLSNLIVAIEHPDDFENVNYDTKPSISFILLRRYLTTLMTGRSTISEKRTFFLAMQRALKINSSAMNSFRRDIVEWRKVPTHSQRVIIAMFYKELVQGAVHTDLAIYFRQHIYRQ